MEQCPSRMHHIRLGHCSVAPEAMSALPGVAAKARVRPPGIREAVSLAVVLWLLFAHRAYRVPEPSVLQPSLFRAREAPASYVSARGYANYAFGGVCSRAARAVFARRFQLPHRPSGLARAPLGRAESGNRVLVSAVPHEVGDGLGHRMCILNYELHMSMALGVSYSHRVSGYGSLTRDDLTAVERLFGWGRGEITRERVMHEACAEVVRVNDTCEIPSPNLLCTKLKPRSEGGLFDRIVMVPDELAECYLRRGPDQDKLDELCYPLVRRFLAAFSEPNTLFHMKPKLCFHNYLYTNFSETVDWFHEKYWAGEVRNIHSGSPGKEPDLPLLPVRVLRASENPVSVAGGRRGSAKAGAVSLNDIAVTRVLTESAAVAAAEAAEQADLVNGMSARPRVRTISLDPKRVHIALHVRRGDFFNYTNRVLIPDSTFADMAGRIKVALDEIVDGNVPVTVHVYSEGVPLSKMRLKDNHDIASMKAVYVNEFGHHMPPDHWTRLVRSNVRLSSGHGVGRGWSRPDIDVKMHVATDTVTALHNMLAADFFVGSISGLSMQVVRNLGRGLTLLPIHVKEVLADEFIVPFDYARNGIASFLNETLLYEQVAVYARKNRIACSVL